eukprot:6183946-Pleurochrysis_carterae.AAC.6
MPGQHLAREVTCSGLGLFTPSVLSASQISERIPSSGKVRAMQTMLRARACCLVGTPCPTRPRAKLLLALAAADGTEGCKQCTAPQLTRGSKSAAFQDVMVRVVRPTARHSHGGGLRLS